MLEVEGMGLTPNEYKVSFEVMKITIVLYT